MIAICAERGVGRKAAEGSRGVRGDVERDLVNEPPDEFRSVPRIAIAVTAALRMGRIEKVTGGHDEKASQNGEGKHAVFTARLGDMAGQIVPQRPDETDIC